MEIVTTPSTVRVTLKTTAYRIESIDLLRGLVMIIMALDHVRDYFHVSASVFDPTDLSQTNTLLFFTRWITHFCAPVFMFLSGTSAYLVGIKKGKNYLSRFLFTRGLWLIFLELTVINFAWYFNINFNSIDFLVIWALGVSMIALAGLIYLRRSWIIFIGLAMVFGHNLLDNVHVPGTGLSSFGWSLLHEPGFFSYAGHEIFVGYPIIPWIGVMALGYCLGAVYNENYGAEKRKKFLVTTGLAAIILFIGLRYTNVYGDAAHWSQQSTATFTVLSFLNVSKYPPSLLYLLVTLGPALLFLAFTENTRNWLAAQIKMIGRVPMFYYLVHLYVLHLAAMAATYFCGFTWRDMILTTWINFDPKLHGYGFSLSVVYIVWFCLVTVLYFLCRWYDAYKTSHREKWWLTYL